MVSMFFVLRSVCCGCVLWCSRYQYYLYSLKHSKQQKEQDNANNQSGPYAAAGSITATMRNPPTKLMGNLS
jgi:hypothetical protein